LQDQPQILYAKALIAVIATATLAWDAASGSSRRESAWLRDATLAALAVVSLAAWFNFGQFHRSGQPFHYHDFFHYYVGSKYFAELEYTRLYDCVAAAEVSVLRSPEIADRPTRDLRTNQILRGSPAAGDPELCRRHFTAERWDSFLRDVEWFRSRMSPQAWNQVQVDRGYNGTPFWTVVGGSIARIGGMNRITLVLLASIDWVIVIVMWIVVWRTFGWRAMAVALIWWGLNYPARYGYTGGAFLRQGWLVLLVLAICLMKRGYAAAAGASIGAAAMLRIFPLAVAFGPLLRARWLRREAIGRSDRRLVAATAATAVVLVAITLSFPTPFERDTVYPWRLFAQNSMKHMSTPAVNRIGLRTALAFDPATRAVHTWREDETDPWKVWRESRTTAFEQRRAIYLAVVALFVLLLTKAVLARSMTTWTTLVACVGLIPVLLQLSGYYYGVLLAYGLLWPQRKAIGVGLGVLTTATCLVPLVIAHEDDRYAAISIAVLCFVFHATVSLRRLPDRSSETLLPK
jgi:hypothetical protein